MVDMQGVPAEDLLHSETRTDGVTCCGRPGCAKERLAKAAQDFDADENEGGTACAFGAEGCTGDTGLASATAPSGRRRGSVKQMDIPQEFPAVPITPFTNLINDKGEIVYPATEWPDFRKETDNVNQLNISQARMISHQAKGIFTASLESLSLCWQLRESESC